MTATGVPVLGTILNRDQVLEKKVGKVAASTNITKGALVYQDAANGWKIAPTDGSVVGSRLFVAGHDADNSSGVLGDKTVEVYGHGAEFIGKAEGAITVDADVKASRTTAGSLAANTLPTAPAATYGEAAADSLYDFVIAKLGKYLGHYGEHLETGNLPTNAADAETNCVFRITR